MNGNNEFDSHSIFNVCRVCLKTANDLSSMSDEHINMYRTMVDDIAHFDTNMKACTICNWMFKKFIKFKRQCLSTNNLLKEMVFMDTKHILYLQNLKSSHHYVRTGLEINDYSPYKFENEIYVNGRNDTYDNRTVEQSDTFKNESDATNDETYGYDNDIIIDNDEDDVPLVLFCVDGEGNKKRNKKKKKLKNETQNQEDNLSLKEKSDVKEEVGPADGKEKRVKKERSKKALKDGFTSRMVQETDEYVVIKLNKEQVLQEMAERSKTEAFLRSPFKCDKCVKGFNFEDVLQTHLDKHSMKNGKFQCDMCGQYCPSAVSLRGHVKSHTTRYKCKLCGHTRLSRQHLLEHHSISHTSAATAYKCDYCQFTTNKRTVMQRHVRRHGAGEPHACEKCGKLFKSIESLRLHTVRHDKSSHFQCDRCATSFVYASLLRRHVQCVHERRDYYCVECDVQFKSADSLRLHFKKAKRHRDSSANKYVCAHCPSRFFTPASLAVHLSAAHNEPKAHPCPHCRRLYSSRDAVRAHAWRVHARGDARAACPHCGTSFARKSTLKLHLRTHTGARPHACHCGAAFAQHKTLQAHVQAKHKKDEVQQYENKIEV